MFLVPTEAWFVIPDVVQAGLPGVIMIQAYWNVCHIILSSQSSPRHGSTAEIWVEGCTGDPQPERSLIYC